MTPNFNLVHLYAREMNIYGDYGNVLALKRRLEWRGYGVTVQAVGIGEDLPKRVDIIFAGGGQDRGQIAVGRDLQVKSGRLHELAAAGTPMLTICGTYQLFGRRFTTIDGTEIPGIGIFNAETKGSPHRMIGNVIIESALGQIVGFENHSGETFLAAGQASLGQVIKGFGNNYAGGQEGAVTNNVYGTYLHGPVLPKNPALADALLVAALKRCGIGELSPLDDTLESQGAEAAMQRPQ